MKLQNFFKETIDGELHTLQAPPVNFITEDGRTIINFNLSPNDMIAHGWREWTNEELEAWHAQYDPVPPITVKDYDDAMEAHLKAEREARGYTTREPDYYLTSTVPRWAQDARDWVAHRDEVMLYALDIENKYEAGEPVPTLDEFRAALPVIRWTVELSDAEA